MLSGIYLSQEENAYVRRRIKEVEYSTGKHNEKTTTNLSICRPCNYSKAYSVHVALNNTTNISKELFPSSPILNTIEAFRKQQIHDFRKLTASEML